MPNAPNTSNTARLRQGTHPSDLKDANPWFVILPFILILILILWAARLQDGSELMDLRLTLIAVGCVVDLLLALALISITFARFGLCDSTQALALPEGSIRAVIAITLLVVLVLLSLTFFMRMANQGHVVLTDLNSEEKNRIVSSAPDRVLAVETQQPPVDDKGNRFWEVVYSPKDGSTISGVDEQNKGSIEKAAEEAGFGASSELVDGKPRMTFTNPQGATLIIHDLSQASAQKLAESTEPHMLARSIPSKWRLRLSVPPNRETSDLAKQVITGMMTLVASVVSFYFGTRAVSSQNDKKETVDQGAAATLVSVEPPSAPVGNLPELTLHGNNLNQIKKIEFRQGANTVPSDFTPDPTATEKLKVLIPNGQKPWEAGAVDIIGTDSNGQQVVLASAFKIELPAVTVVNLHPTEQDVSTQTPLVITGTNLDQVESVLLKSDGKPDVECKLGTVTPSRLEFTPLKPAIGSWGIVVTDKAKRTTTLQDKLTLKQ